MPWFVADTSLPVGQVDRTALVERIIAAGPGAVATIVAPAGFGKSTLIDQLRAVLPTSVYLDLHAAHDRPQRFVSDLLTAVSAEPTAQAGGEFDPSAFAAHVVDLLEHIDMPTALILDNVHEVTNPDVLEAIASIAWHTERDRVVLASRRPLPIGVARLKVRRKLIDINSDDLVIDDADAVTMLAAMAPDASREWLTAQAASVGGWPAGLVLVGAALLQRGDTTIAGINALADIHEFMRTEVLDQLPPQLVEFLLELSIIGTFDRELVSVVTQREDAGSLLDEVLARRLFVEQDRSNPTMMCFHELFSTVLTLEAAVIGDERRRLLEQRTIQALTDVGLADLAVDRLLVSDDARFVGEFLRRNAHNTLFTRGTGGLLSPAIRAADIADDSVALQGALYMAASGFDVRRAAEFHDALERLLPWTDDNVFPSGLSTRALYATLTWQHDHALEMYERAIERMPVAEWAGTVPYYLTHAGVMSEMFWTDRIEDCEHAAHRAIEARRHVGSNAMICYVHSLRSIAASQRGEASTAAGALEAAHASAELSTTPLDRAVHAAATILALLADGDAVTARRVGLATVLHPTFVRGIPSSALASLTLARAELQLGMSDAAAARIAEVRSRLRQATGARYLERVVSDLEGSMKIGPDAAAPAPRSAASIELTDRERAIARLLGSRMTLREIGDELFLSVNTVKTYTQSIYRKLGVTSRNEVVELFAPRLRVAGRP